MINIHDVSMKFNLNVDKNASVKGKVIGLFKKKEEDAKKDFWALKDINFQIKKGEVFGLIGGNGAGKSTLLKVISGVMQPTTGTVALNGNICAMIELGAGFDTELTARENVFLNGAIMGYSKKFLTERYDEIIDFAELRDFEYVPIKNFSSGMLARLAFSVSIIVDPEILIVDEILSVGDISFQKKSEKRMKDMILGGTTVVYVSHSLSSIKQLCNRVAWLDHGHIVEIGETNEVCGHYYDKMINL